MNDISGNPVCALIGVGPGLGLSLARKFGSEVCELALVARRANVLTNDVQTLAKEGIVARAFPADVTDLESLDRAFAAIGDSFGPPTILLYNAASVTRLPSSELAVDTFMRDLTVNAEGPLAAVQWVVPAMRLGGGGTILFSSAGVGVDPEPGWASYAASKAALRNLAFSVAAEFADDDIHVTTVTIAGRIEPGSSLDPDRLAAAYRRFIPRRRMTGRGNWSSAKTVKDEVTHRVCRRRYARNADRNAPLSGTVRNSFVSITSMWTGASSRKRWNCSRRTCSGR